MPPRFNPAKVWTCLPAVSHPPSVPVVVNAACFKSNSAISSDGSLKHTAGEWKVTYAILVEVSIALLSGRPSLGTVLPLPVQVWPGARKKAAGLRRSKTSVPDRYRLKISNSGGELAKVLGSVTL